MKQEEGLKIGEVASMLGVKPYVLRYWETEFSQIIPERTKTKQRLYTKKNIEILKTVQYLLHDQGLTIEGARKIINEGYSSYVTVEKKPEDSVDKGSKNNEQIIGALEELRMLLLSEKK